MTSSHETPDARAPGRPRAFVTEAALDAALELFWKRGYRVTTTRELESYLALTASSLYNAFGSKEALLLAALDRYEARITEGLLRPLESSGEGLEALERFFRDLGHWILHEGRRGCMLVNLMAENGGQDGAVAKRVRAYCERLRRAFQGALGRAAEAGDIPPGASRARADLLLCQVFGMNVAARGGAKPAELRRMLTAVQTQLRDWSTREQRAHRSSIR